MFQEFNIILVIFLSFYSSISQICNCNCCCQGL